MQGQEGCLILHGNDGEQGGKWEHDVWYGVGQVSRAMVPVKE